MKLLFITQKIAKEDPTLGFFHDWVFKLASHFEKISVICLEKGDADLPKNVAVYSLGKEKSRNRFKYVVRFLNYILGLTGEYDAVFVHMNQEYVLMGGWLWKILRKKVYLWRNHPHGNILTKLAVYFSDRVFCTSTKSYTARFKKSIIMPVGIDTEKFKVTSAQARKKNGILSLGRISPIKNIHLLLKAARILKEKNITFTLDILGDPVNEEDLGYKIKLMEENKDLIEENIVSFYPAVPNHTAPEIYNNHGIFVNLTPSGSFDKTILEAAVCGCIPIIANKSLDGDIFREGQTDNNPESVAQTIEYWLKADEVKKEETKNKLQNYVIQNHSLDILIEKIIKIISKN